MAKTPKLYGVQYVRAAAALMVVYVHVIDQVPQYRPALEIHTVIDSIHFNSGVQLFFVVSGIVMYLTGIEMTPGTFAWHRLRRIVPLYWLLTLAVILLAVALPGLFRHTQVTLGAALKSFFFIPYADPARAEIDPPEPLLGPGWSLNYEMFFYALFALALVLPRVWRMPALCTALAVLVCAGLTHPGNFYAAFYTRPELGLFCAGLIIGWIYCGSRPRLSKWASVALILVGLAILLGSWPITPIDKLVGPIPILLGVCALDFKGETPHWPILALLGDASYSLYLTHIFTLGALRAVWPLAFGAAAFAIVGVLASVCIGVACYFIVEKPMLNALSRKS